MRNTLWNKGKNSENPKIPFAPAFPQKFLKWWMKTNCTALYDITKWDNLWRFLLILQKERNENSINYNILKQVPAIAEPFSNVSKAQSVGCLVTNILLLFFQQTTCIFILKSNDIFRLMTCQWLISFFKFKSNYENCPLINISSEQINKSI